MSNYDGGSRVDQYFVTSYTEVCIIIRYRSNLNHLRSISAYNRDIHNRNDEKSSLKKMSGVRVRLVIYSDSFGEPPRRGVCPFLYFQRVPRDMRVVSPPVSLLPFHARTPAQWNWCKYYSYHNIYTRIVIFKTSTNSESVFNMNSSKKKWVLSENYWELCLWIVSLRSKSEEMPPVLDVPISGSISARNFSFS